MSVLCAIPLQIPVHRVRATVLCRELRTPLHTAVRRLSEHAGANSELIAAATGATLARVEQVQGELAHRLAPIEREYLLWVDHARERCLPYEALDGVVVVRGRDGGVTLPVDPPTPASLARMNLSAAASWASGIDGHVEIEAVVNVLADIRGAWPSGAGRLSHVLRLPDTHLLVATTEEDPDELQVALTQHASENSELTAWLHDRYGPQLAGDILDLEHLTPHAPPPRWLTELAAPGWRYVEPHPAHLRQTLLDITEAAKDRLDLCAPDLTTLPAWLRDALTQTLARGVAVVLHPRKPEHVPKRLGTTAPLPGEPLPVQPLPAQPGALCVVADAKRAAIHTDAPACLDRTTSRTPHPQHLRSTAEREAVAELMGLLTLRPPPRRKPSEQLGTRAIRRLLTQALAALAPELPAGVTATIEPDDEQAAAAALDRYNTDPRQTATPTAGMQAVAAGIAWERIVIATAQTLCDEHLQLDYLAARWSPPQGAIDLDVLVADHAKRTVWVLDAKNSTPTNDQQGKLVYQLRVLKNDSDLIPAGWRPLGVIVHRTKQLPASPHQTEQRSILRAALPDLPALLLTDTLPDQRVA